MSYATKCLGISIRGNCMSYCLIVDDTLRKAGAISLKCATAEHPSRIGNLLSLLKNETEKDHKMDEKNDGLEEPWIVGLQFNQIVPRSAIHAQQQFNLCRIRAMVECHCNLIFRAKPQMIREQELFRTIAKITNERITNNSCLSKYAKARMYHLYTSVGASQFHGIALAWATAVCLKRKSEADSLKLDKEVMLKIERRIKCDKIVSELISNLEKENDEGAAKEMQGALKNRVNRLVDRYIERMF